MESLWSRGYSPFGDSLLNQRGSAGRASVLSTRSRNVFEAVSIWRDTDLGRGEYQYFNYPLPATIDALRRELYGQLVSTAREWTAALSRQQEYPDELSFFLSNAAAAGQARPTPLLLRYQAGDFNCLHQDLYRGNLFPVFGGIG